MFTWDFNEPEFIDYYINFLKSISLKLKSMPIQLFYNPKHARFPLLERSLRFYNYPDIMVSTSVKNVILNCFKLCDNKHVGWYV